MPRECSICSHPEKGEIENELRSGTSLRDIASRFGTSKSSLERHSSEHILEPGQVEKQELDESGQAPMPAPAPPGYDDEEHQLFLDALRGVEGLEQGSKAWRAVAKSAGVGGDDGVLVRFLRAAGWVSQGILNPPGSDSVISIFWDPAPKNFGVDEHECVLRALWAIEEHELPLQMGSEAWTALLAGSGLNEERLVSWLRKMGYQRRKELDDVVLWLPPEYQY